jgi:hypothetical protein
MVQAPGGTVATYVALGFKTVVPLICQIATPPDVSRQRMPGL